MYRRADRYSSYYLRGIAGTLSDRLGSTSGKEEMDEEERPDDAARKFAYRLVGIEELHQPKTICTECGREWPCPTSRWLDENPEAP